MPGRRRSWRSTGWLVVCAISVWSIDVPGEPQRQPTGDERRSDPAAAGEPAELVDIRSMDDTVELDIRYASERNFTGVALYRRARCLLRRAVAERLVRVQQRLRERGLGLRVWDCYRPISVQQRLWQRVPDGRYVARPVFRQGRPVRGSRHNRGAAVDVTLIGAEGQTLPMPTDHDDFSERAHVSYRGGSRVARRNMRILRAAMKAEGFTGIASEWWHFDGPDWRDYPLSDVPLAAAE